MWTFAILPVPQITYRGHNFTYKILLISRTPLLQALNSFIMLRFMSLYYLITNELITNTFYLFMSSCFIPSFNYFFIFYTTEVM